uniref:J domain-containing protein n=1 Tax=Clytia hemisphaerica TaxID=252671 RepID=A0A7M5XBC5_9CNID
MAGMKFEYDEKGTTFYYFILSFCAIFLIPTTYYLFPDDSKKKKTEDDTNEKRKPCYCPPCMAKQDLIVKKIPKKKIYLIRAVLIILWALLITGVVKVSQFEKEYSEYNPYDILQIEVGATQAEIRKKYRDLSKLNHPDKGGDAVVFMKISKAYQALTDEETKKNWEDYGNPDGPGATQFGIALPSWIVDKKNSMWVLGAYMLAFIIILPIVVGSWWYRSIQYSAEEVLLDTEQLFWYFLHRTPNMSLKRAIMILAGALEFDKSHNAEVQERPSDNVELPQLMRELPQLNEKNKERPLCFAYSIKARALMHAHFSRIALPQQTLLKDLELILKKSPTLVREMINIVGQLMYLAKMGRVSQPPKLETMENLMKLSQMLIQGVWESKSTFQMLPHISQENLRHFNTKKRKIKTIRQFVGMNNTDRRMLLRTLSDEQYQDVLNVCSSFPHLEIEATTRVIDDEDMETVTVGSTVTALVTLTRKTMEEFFGDESEEVSLNNIENNDDATASPKPVKGWQRKVKKGKGAKKPVKKQPVKKKKKEDEKQEDKTENKEEKDEEADEESYDGVENMDSEDENAADDEADEQADEADDKKDEEDDDEDEGNMVERDDGADDEWSSIKDDMMQPDRLLDAKSKESHIVHCPYYPMEKHEYWWVYLINKKNNQLVTAPQQVTNLKVTEKVQLKFSAPEKPGIYQYIVVVKSDSYVDFDMTKPLKVAVSEAKDFDPGEHWNYSSEDDDKDDSGESVYETEEEDDDDDDEE